MANLIADLRALAPGAITAVWVQGASAAGDGGGGFYAWDAAAMDADDGNDWIKPDAVDGGDPGRWHRIPGNSGDYAAGDHDHDAEYQPLDARLSALAGLDSGAGAVWQSGADTFEKRAIGTASGTIAGGDHAHLSAQANNALTTGPQFWVGSQAQYDGLTPDDNTFYAIV